jgi:hypothetical protein
VLNSAENFACLDHRSAPRVAGLLVKVFVWILEMPIVGWVLLYILKKDNLINKVQLRHLNALPLCSFLLFFCLAMGGDSHFILIFSSPCVVHLEISTVKITKVSPIKKICEHNCFTTENSLFLFTFLAAGP